MFVVECFRLVRGLLGPFFIASCFLSWQAHGTAKEDSFQREWVLEKPGEISIVVTGSEGAAPPMSVPGLRENVLYTGKATVDYQQQHRGLTRSLVDKQCRNDSECVEYLYNYHIVENDKTNITRPPFCKFMTDNRTSEFPQTIPTSSGDEEEKPGYCSCDPNYCESYSRTSEGTPFYYCGPCGRVGSECKSTNSSCMHELAECRNGFCECIQDGVFYELFFCYVPYYGYEVALQMAITTCIVIALCLLIASVISFFGHSHRLSRLQRLARWRRGSEVTQSPPGDSPPTYDDVVEKLPSYQDALAMLPDQAAPEGIDNPSFTGNESPPPTYEVSLLPSSPADPSSGTSEPQDAKPSPAEGAVAADPRNQEQATLVASATSPGAVACEEAPGKTEGGEGPPRAPPTLQPIEAVLHDALSRSSPSS